MSLISMSIAPHDLIRLTEEANRKGHPHSFVQVNPRAGAQCIELIWESELDVPAVTVFLRADGTWATEMIINTESDE